jgi:predicted TIM-barrel fold metal-dependent hydrolase
MQHFVRSIDCHAHVFLSRLPMTPAARYTPDHDAPLEEYIQLLNDNGVERAVLVQVSFLGVDNSFLLAALARGGARLRGVAVVDVTTPLDHLQDLRSAGIAAVRHNLIGQSEPDLTGEAWATHLSAVAAAGLHVEVQAEGTALARILPALVGSGIRVVVDHFGRPSTEDPRDDPGFAAVLELAAEGDVWVKLSAPYRFAADPVRAARLLIDRIGHERLVWGSDWPWTQHPEIKSYAALRSALIGWVGNDSKIAETIMYDNPLQLYWR